MPKKRKVIKVRKWIGAGELDADCKDSEQILCYAAKLMDKSCAYEIVGSPLFLGDDGEYYVVEINAQIFRADEDYVKQRLAEIKEERKG